MGLGNRIRRDFRKASLSRAFEEELFKRVKDKEIKIPVYMSAEQVYFATITVYLEHLKKQKNKFLYSIEVIRRLLVS